MPARVLGLGNRLRRDDGVGPWVASELARRVQGADVRQIDGDGFALLDAFGGAHEVLLVDAVAGPLPQDALRCSTHALGVVEAVELARALGQLPARLHVYGIEGADFGSGEGLSPAVAAAAGALVEELLIELTEACRA